MSWKREKEGVIAILNYTANMHITTKGCSEMSQKMTSIPWWHLFVPKLITVLR